jgi:transposase
MMRPCGEDLKIYLHRAPIDMRKGRNALAALAQEVMKVDPFAGALFVYIGRRFNALKLIYWDRNGFALWKPVVATPVVNADPNDRSGHRTVIAPYHRRW